MGLNFDEEIASSELKPLIQALSGFDSVHFETDWENPRIKDLAEAFDKHPLEVAQALAELRERTREAHVVEVLTELEEPLHRVERPGLDQYDSMSRQQPLVRTRQIKTILDSLPKEGMTVKLIKETKVSKVEKTSTVVATIFLFLVTIGIIAICAFGIWKAIH